MIYYRLLRFWVVLLSLLVIGGCQQMPYVVDSALVADPVDPGILQGQLDNGLRYYVRSANSAERDDKIELRLIVRTGSIHENPAEAGYSHLLEHVVFRGTRHFSAARIENLLEQYGLVWGRDVNATTHYGATIYRFSLTENEKALIPEILQLYADFIADVSVAPQALAAEKRIVQAEWMHRYGHKSFVVDPLTVAAFDGTGFDGRPPAGQLGSIRNATVESLQAFWHKWYSPARAAVIVTGNVVPWELEPSIVETFGDIPRRTADHASVPPIRLNDIAADGKQFVTFVEPEFSDTEAAVNFITQIPDTASGHWSNQQFVHALLFETVSRMMVKHVRSQSCGDPQFGYSILDSGQSMFRISSFTDQTSVLHCLNALEVALQQVGSYAMHPTEYRILQDRFRELAMEEGQRYRGADSGMLADRITQSFILGVPVFPAALYETRLLESIDSFGAARFNDFLANIDSEFKLVYSAIGPSADQLPAAETLERSVMSATLQPPGKFSRTPDSDVEDTVVRREKQSAAGRRILLVDRDDRVEWQLGSGARVVLIKDDRYNYLAAAMVASGGMRAGSDDLSAAAALLPSLVESGSVESSTELVPAQFVESALFVNPTHHGILAYAVADEPESLFATLDQYFRGPVVLKDGKLSSTGPGVRSAGELNAVYEDYFQLPETQGLRNISKQQITDAYYQLYLSPSAFTTVFVGNISKEQIEPLLDQLDYHVVDPALIDASPQTVAASYKAPDDSSRTPAPVDTNRVEVDWIHHCTSSVDAESEPYLRLLSHVLQRRLRLLLREDNGLSYAPEVHLLDDAAPRDGGRLHHIRYIVRGEDLNSAHRYVKAVLDGLGRQGISHAEYTIAMAREQKRRADLSHDYLSFAAEQAIASLHHGGIANDQSLTLDGANRAVRCFSSNNASIFRAGQSIGYRNVVSFAPGE